MVQNISDITTTTGEKKKKKKRTLLSLAISHNFRKYNKNHHLIVYLGPVHEISSEEIMFLS